MTQAAAPATQGELVIDLSHIALDLRVLAGDISGCIADLENTNTHSKDQLNKIAASLKRYGQIKPIVVNTKTRIIIAGNGTHAAAKMLGWKHIAINWVDYDKKTATSLGYVDNELGKMSGTNFTQLKKNVKDLASSDEGRGMLLEIMDEFELTALTTDTFEKADADSESFSGDDIKGRPIKDISAAQRVIVDRAMLWVRGVKGTSITDGAVLQIICEEFIALKKGPSSDEAPSV